MKFRFGLPYVSSINREFGILFIVFFLLPSLLFGLTPKSSWKEITIQNTNAGKLPETIFFYLNDEEKEMFQQANELTEDFYAFTIRHENDSYYLNKNCHQNLWKWNGTFWEPLGDLEIVGSYCLTNWVFYKGEIFHLGGTGFWENKSDLIRLNQDFKKFEFVQTKNQPENFYAEGNFFMNSGMFFWVGEIANARINEDKIRSEGRFLDLETLSWQNIQTTWLDKKAQEDFQSLVPKKYFGLDLNRFGLLFYEKDEKNESGMFILDKDDRQIYQFNQIYIWDHNTSFLIIYPEDKLEVQFLNQRTPIIFQFGGIIKNLTPVASITIDQSNLMGYNLSPYFSYSMALPIFLILLILGFLVVKSINNGKITDSINNPILMHPELAVFIPIQGQVLSQERMDILLGLEGVINPDLRKVNRSRKIQQINQDFERQFGHPLISRTRDEKDKRMILYQINEFVEIKDEKTVVA